MSVLAPMLLNLAWIVPTVILSGAPLWVCILLPSMVILIGITLALA